MIATNTPFAFDFEETPVRVVERDGVPWFVAADVCRVLGIQNSRDALEKLDEDEKGVAPTDTLGGKQSLNIISESGLYCLVLRSREATTPGSVAHRFRKWVTAEVLPALRKEGRYAMPGSRPEISPHFHAPHLSHKMQNRIAHWRAAEAGARARAEALERVADILNCEAARADQALDDLIGMKSSIETVANLHDVSPEAVREALARLTGKGARDADV